jgi:hypothetical protein
LSSREKKKIREMTNKVFMMEYEIRIQETTDFLGG